MTDQVSTSKPRVHHSETQYCHIHTHTLCNTQTVHMFANTPIEDRITNKWKSGEYTYTLTLTFV